MAVEVGGCSEGFGKFAPLLAPVMQSTVVGQSRWRVYPAQENARASSTGYPQRADDDTLRAAQTATAATMRCSAVPSWTPLNR